MNILRMQWLLPVILLITAGCNSDIFIGADQVPTVSDVMLEPGGVSEINYQGEDLWEIALLLPTFSQMNDPAYNDGNPWEHDKPYEGYPTYGREDFSYMCRYSYDSGRCDTVVMRYGGWLEVFTENTELCRSVTVENAFVKLGLEIKPGRRIEIKNMYNLTDSAFKCVLSFDYRYKEDVVNVMGGSTMLTEAGKYVVAGIEYEKDIFRIETHSMDTIPFEAFNYGDDKLRVVLPVAPYSQMFTDFRINPEMVPLFDSGQPEVEVEIPTYEWITYDEDLSYGASGLYGTMIPFSWQTVVMPGLDSAISPGLREIGYSFEHEYGFTLSPHVGVRAYLYVDRITDRVRGKLKARNAVSGNEFLIPVDVIVNQPYFYGMDYERIDLEE